jgi:O-antigen/teichoic acid export membrane protein
MATGRTLPTTHHPLLRFIRHFVEMCVAMCVGVAITLAVLALLGGEAFRGRYPELSLVLIAVMVTIPMTGWMLIRGMPSRATLEMTATTFVVVAALVVAGTVGIGPGVRATVGDVCGLACAAMLVVMAARFELYAGGHHQAPSDLAAADEVDARG